MTQICSRISWSEYERAASATILTLRALGKQIDDSGLEKPLTELLKVRASQLNGCAYCLNFHLAQARTADVLPAKLDLVATWAEVEIFTPRERAGLAWTESLTLMAQQAVADSVYSQLQQQFSTSEIAYLTAAIGLINAWNRIAGGLRFAPVIQP